MLDFCHKSNTIPEIYRIATQTNGNNHRIKFETYFNRKYNNNHSGISVFNLGLNGIFSSFQFSEIFYSDLIKFQKKKNHPYIKLIQSVLLHPFVVIVISIEVTKTSTHKK